MPMLYSGACGLLIEYHTKIRKKSIISIYFCVFCEKSARLQVQLSVDGVACNIVGRLLSVEYVESQCAFLNV